MGQDGKVILGSFETVVCGLVKLSRHNLFSISIILINTSQSLLGRRQGPQTSLLLDTSGLHLLLFCFL